MTTAWFWPLLALIALGSLWIARIVTRKFTAPDPEKPRHYGHPRPPTTALREELPKPPLGHAWETKVTRDESGEYWLHLGLVNAAIGETVAQTKRSLTRTQFGTWAADYRRWPSIAGDIFNKDLIGPMADWAREAVSKMSGPNTFEYKLG